MKTIIKLVLVVISFVPLFCVAMYLPDFIPAGFSIQNIVDVTFNLTMLAVIFTHIMDKIITKIQ
jgi:hypothetical protein